jgi:hypothetical protein
MLRRPSLRALGLALAYLLAASLLLEGLLRLAVARAWMQEPLVGTTVPEFDIKLQLLNQFQQQNQSVDCIVLGSSMVDRGLMPDVLAAQFSKTAGRPITCFNFGVGNLTAASAGGIARLLAQEYHPRLLLYGLSARDMNTHAAGGLTLPLIQNPWIEYKLGHWNLRGWLSENLYLYRTLVHLRYYPSNGYRSTIDDYTANLRPDGYLVRQPHSAIFRSFLIEEFELEQRDLAGVQEVIALNATGIQAVLFELPVNPAQIETYLGGGSPTYWNDFLKPITKFIARQQGIFITSQKEYAGQLNAEDWNDRVHLSLSGARRFSQWLPGQITATLPNPFE